MLGWRLLVSAILIPLVLGLFWWDVSFGTHAPVLLCLCLILTVRGAYEASVLLTTRAMKPSFAVTAACNVLILLSAWAASYGIANADVLTSLGLIASAFAFSFVFLLLYEAIRYREPGHSMESLGGNLITVCYAGVLLAVIAQLRWFPSPAIGYFAIGSVIIAVKGGDIMAYTFGRLWGKRKMVPTLSPGKTWMGGFGALVGSALGAWLWLSFGGLMFDARPQASSLPCVLLYGASLGVIGLVGDLCESLIKRDAEKKDSAALMPGFGGLLDLIDSPLYAAPFALAWWILWPPAL